MEYSNSKRREQVTKSLTLELVPEEGTEQCMPELLKKDAILQENFEKIKPLINGVIKETIARGLENASYDFGKMYDAYLQKIDPNNEKRSAGAVYDKEAEKLTATMVKAIQSGLPNGIKKMSDLKSNSFLKITLPEYVDRMNVSAEEKYEHMANIEALDGCLALMSKYMVSRITALEKQAPKRVLENVEIYFDNIAKAKELLNFHDKCKQSIALKLTQKSVFIGVK